LRGFFSNIMALLLAAHTLLGCCWHDAHACASGTPPLGFETASANPLYVHPHSDSGCPLDGQKHGTSGCKHHSCDFVASQPSKVSDSQRATLPHLFAAVQPRSICADQRPAEELSRLFGLFHPPVRLNLINLVLLI
jgi:hypothetical protein